MKFLSKINTQVIKIGLVVAVLLMVAAPLVLYAQTAPNPQDELDKAAQQAGMKGTETDLTIIVGRIISLVIQFLGVIAVVIILIGGFKWMTSGGDSEKIKSARQLMTNGIIGLVIIVLAYAIVTFILKRVAVITLST